MINNSYKHPVPQDALDRLLGISEASKNLPKEKKKKLMPLSSKQCVRWKAITE